MGPAGLFEAGVMVTGGSQEKMGGGQCKPVRGLSGERRQAFPSGGLQAGFLMKGEMRVSKSKELGKPFKRGVKKE